MKGLRLVLILIRRSPFRAIMLAALIAVCSLVFSVVSELSRVSQEGLTEAIIQDNGLVGSYGVTFGEFPVPVRDQYHVVLTAAEALDMEIWGYAEVLPPVQSECPPYEQVGEQVLQVLWESPGMPANLPYGQVDGIDTRWCIDGQSIPSDALFAASPEEASLYGSQLYIDPSYRNLVALSTTGTLTYRFTLASGRDEDATEALSAQLAQEMDALALPLGYIASDMVTVWRIDQDGTGVRDAAEGVAVVYDLIRWGVLGLAGIALTTVQTLSARQRGWFHGLLTALGASRRRLVAVVMYDSVLVVTGGLTLAVLTLALANDAIASFAHDAFQVQASGIEASTLIPLACGIVAVAALAALGPSLAISRSDPLAVLEAPRD